MFASFPGIPSSSCPNVLNTCLGNCKSSKPGLDVTSSRKTSLWSSGFGNLISGSSAFSKTSLNIWKFTVHVLLKPGLENFEHYFASVWDECNCAVVWTFFGIAFLWDWNENWPSCVCFYNLGTSIVLGKNTLLPYSGYTCFRRNWTYLPVLGVGNPALAKESTGSPCFQKLILSLAWIPNQANENQPRCWLAALQKRKSAFL